MLRKAHSLPAVAFFMLGQEIHPVRPGSGAIARALAKENAAALTSLETISPAGSLPDFSPPQELGVDDRIRTGDRLDHNQELYQLSYVHRAGLNLACPLADTLLGLACVWRV
jgi:hypothetical protein